MEGGCITSQLRHNIHGHPHLNDVLRDEVERLSMFSYVAGQITQRRTHHTLVNTLLTDNKPSLLNNTLSQLLSVARVHEQLLIGNFVFECTLYSLHHPLLRILYDSFQLLNPFDQHRQHLRTFD